MKNNFIKKSENTWNNIAYSFDKTRKKPWDECLSFISQLHEKYVIADLGCGNGRHLIPASKKIKKAIGVDISIELLKIVKNKNENNQNNIYLFQSDIPKLPFKNDSFDAIFFIAALHNIETRTRRINALKEIQRILKYDKKALISVWSRWQDKYRKYFLKKWFKTFYKTDFGDIDIYWRQHGLNLPRFYHLYSKKEFISDLKEANLKIIDIQNVYKKSKKYPDNYFAIVTK